MELIILAGIATAFNFLIILWKYTHKRTLDASLDLGILVIISMLFAGTSEGLQIGMLASAIVSIYLLLNQPKLTLPDWI